MQEVNDITNNKDELIINKSDRKYPRLSDDYVYLDLVSSPGRV